jgi:hypothetical protein
MPVDMSAKAVTARLKLVSDLRDLCLLLGKAKFEDEPNGKSKPNRKHKSVRTKRSK